MLHQEFLRAEKLAKENDEPSLVAMKTSYDRKVGRAALLGLASLLLLLFEEWLAKRFAPHLLSFEAFRTAMIVLPAVGFFAYFFLSKRYTDGRSRVDLALELKRRESAAAPKEGG